MPEDRLVLNGLRACCIRTFGISWGMHDEPFSEGVVYCMACGTKMVLDKDKYEWRWAPNPSGVPGSDAE